MLNESPDNTKEGGADRYAKFDAFIQDLAIYDKEFFEFHRITILGIRDHAKHMESENAALEATTAPTFYPMPERVNAPQALEFAGTSVKPPSPENFTTLGDSGILDAVASGMISGRISEWPQVKRACIWACERLKGMA